MTITPNSKPRFVNSASTQDEAGAPRIAIHPDVPMGVCLGEFCPDQTNSVGETEGVDAIRATVRACELAVGCILRNSEVVPVEVPNA